MFKAIHPFAFALETTSAILYYLHSLACTTHGTVGEHLGEVSTSFEVLQYSALSSLPSSNREILGSDDTYMWGAVCLYKELSEQ